MTTSNPRDALEDMVRSLQVVFKKYDRNARRKGWNAVVSSKGKDEINKLIDSPTRQIKGLSQLLSFKEWLNNER